MANVSPHRPNLFLRHDTIFGVCEGLGQDFGFNPLYLRVALTAATLWSPPLVIGAYLAAGVVVAATRLLVPDRTIDAAEATVEAEAPECPADPLAIAA